MGNRLIGIQNDVVHFGTPWYVRRGALENLRSAVITEYSQEEGRPMRTQILAIATRSQMSVDGQTKNSLSVQTIKRSVTLVPTSLGQSY